MKIILTILIVTLATPFTASGEDKSSGCGLGWKVTDKTSFLATTTRQSTNLTIPNTFGMTSGTSGCAQHSFAKKDLPAVEFVASNYEPLVLQLAEGQGEYVDGFARAMGCDSAASRELGRMMQRKFQSIVTDSPIDLFKRVKQELRANPVLAIGCNA